MGASQPASSSVDLGSTLGLYFGMSILTLFELVIFVFYRDASDPFTVKTG